MSLLKSNAKHLLVLQFLRFIVRIDGHDIIVSFFLGFEDLKRLRRIARSDNAVGYLPLDHPGRHLIADIRQCHPVAKGTHAVRPPGACIGAGERRCIQTFYVIDKISSFLFFRERDTDCPAGRGYMLKGCGCREGQRLF